jgi:hypothetical protein
VTEQKFFIEAMHGPIEVSLALTGPEMQRLLIGTPEPLIVDTIIEVLCQYPSLSKKVQYFLNKEDEEAAIALTSKLAYLEGRPCYEVNLMKMFDESVRTDVSEGHDATFFYTPDRKRVCVAASFALANILDNREGARYLGVVAYAEDGIGYYEWEPKNEIPF